MQIEDGTGTGRRAEVNDENQLVVEAIAESEHHWANHDKGLGFSVPFNQSPTAADDCIFYAVNDDDDNDLIVEGIDLGVDGTTLPVQVYMKLGTKGTRNAATALTPVNNHAGSGNIAEGTFEKGADLDGGAATLGDTEAGLEFARWIFFADADTQHFNFPQDVILNKNETFTIWTNQADVTLYAVLYFYYAP